MSRLTLNLKIHSESHDWLLNLTTDFWISRLAAESHERFSVLRTCWYYFRTWPTPWKKKNEKQKCKKSSCFFFSTKISTNRSDEVPPTPVHTFAWVSRRDRPSIENKGRSIPTFSMIMYVQQTNNQKIKQPSKQGNKQKESCGFFSSCGCCRKARAWAWEPNRTVCGPFDCEEKKTFPHTNK